MGRTVGDNRNARRSERQYEREEKVSFNFTPETEGNHLLVLSRKKNEPIVIGENIVITVVEVRGDRVRLGIEAPQEIPVHRSEVAALIGMRTMPGTVKIFCKRKGIEAAIGLPYRLRDPNSGATKLFPRLEAAEKYLDKRGFKSSGPYYLKD